MKARIVVTGQLSGNNILKSNLSGSHFIQKFYNDYHLFYNSIKEAKSALLLAYDSLCLDEPEMKGKMSGIRKSANNRELYYDASKAVIF
jgi:hypothetical protein